jgi:hypothetical protein
VTAPVPGAAAPGQAAELESLAGRWEAHAKRNRVHGQLAVDQGDEYGAEGFAFAQAFEACAAELRAAIAAAAPAAPPQYVIIRKTGPGCQPTAHGPYSAAEATARSEPATDNESRMKLLLGRDLDGQ